MKFFVTIVYTVSGFEREAHFPSVRRPKTPASALRALRNYQKKHGFEVDIPAGVSRPARFSCAVVSCANCAGK